MLLNHIMKLNREIKYKIILPDSDPDIALKNIIANIKTKTFIFALISTRLEETKLNEDHMQLRISFFQVKMNDVKISQY